LKKDGRKKSSFGSTKLLIDSYFFESFWNIDRKIFVLFNNNSKLIWVILKEKKRRIEARCMVWSLRIELRIEILVVNYRKVLENWDDIVRDL
jgi:hypothetical protein